MLHSVVKKRPLVANRKKKFKPLVKSDKKTISVCNF